MLALVLRPGWLRDLPLCFPGRDCYDVPPGGAQVMYVISDLTSASPGIAAVLWAGLGASLVLLCIGLRRHRREHGTGAWTPLLATTLIVAGAILAWSTNAWLGEAAVVYGGADGRPAEPTPLSVIGAWPLAGSAARAGIALGAVTLLLMLSTTAVRRHATRARSTSRSRPGRPG